MGWSLYVSVGLGWGLYIYTASLENVHLWSVVLWVIESSDLSLTQSVSSSLYSQLKVSGEEDLLYVIAKLDSWTRVVRLVRG